ncbi:MAG: AMP-binding protein [Planctomycetota bacterium]
MNICEHLSSTAVRHPDRVAIVFEGRSWTYQQLDRLSITAADRLSIAGVSAGERVAIRLPNVPAFVVWYYASLRIGAIAVSISTRLTDSEVAFVVADCEAKVLVTDESAPETLNAGLPTCVQKSLAVSDAGDRCNAHALLPAESSGTWHDANADDPALILYTSGTTGFAKGATLSHNNVRSNVLEFNRLCNMQPSDRILLAVPLFHCFGQNALLNSALNVGATLVLQRGFDLNESKQLIAQERVTQLYGVPTMFQLLHESCVAEDLSTVRYCFSAAAKLPTQVSQRWLEKFDQPIFEGYGLTETSPFASYNHHANYVLGSIGEAIDHVEMKIVDSDSGEDCPTGALGEIAIRGPNVMLGYWNRPEDTAAAIRDGWFNSGDIGRTDDAGLFYIVDRVKDMIAVGGLKVYPAEVERVLLDHELIAQAAVVGLPDEVFGEQVVAFIVGDGDVADTRSASATILSHCRQHLASYKVPKHCEFVGELPRNPSGKILKRQLREFDLTAPVSESANQASEISASLPERSTPLRPPTLWKELEGTYANSRLAVASAFVRNLVQVLSGDDHQLDDESRFLDAGLDSLMVVEMSSQIQAEVGTDTEIPATLVFDYPRVCDMAAFLVSTFEARISNDQQSLPAASESSASPDLREQIAAMSEEEALDELMRELKTS